MYVFGVYPPAAHYLVYTFFHTSFKNPYYIISLFFVDKKRGSVSQITVYLGHDKKLRVCCIRFIITGCLNISRIKIIFSHFVRLISKTYSSAPNQHFVKSEKSPKRSPKLHIGFPQSLIQIRPQRCL